MSFLDKAKTDFEAARTPENLVAVEIPEWERTLFFYPKMNVDEARTLRAYQDADGRYDVEGLAMVLIVRGRDADGVRLFNKASRLELTRHVDAAVVFRVAAEIMGHTASDTVDLGSSEEFEKN